MYTLWSCLPYTYRCSKVVLIAGIKWTDNQAAEWGTDMTCYYHYTATALHLVLKDFKAPSLSTSTTYILIYPLYIMVATMDYEPDTKGNESYILCADCGTVISSANGAGLCK
jgi:hypothetical protein